MIAALQFLTVLRVGGHGRPTSATLAFFPVVGLLVGVSWALTGQLGLLFTGNTTTAALVLIVDALLTGGLHLDALADVTDGAASHKPADEAVAVMRDPATGAVGVAALVLVILLRFGTLIFSVDFAYRLLAAPIAGRTAMVVLLWLLPARSDGSLAQSFGRPGTPVVLAAIVLAAVGSALSGTRGLTALAAALAFAGVYALWWRHRFGPLNGDGAGAGGLLAETLALLVLAAR